MVQHGTGKVFRDQRKFATTFADLLHRAGTALITLDISHTNLKDHITRKIGLALAAGACPKLQKIGIASKSENVTSLKEAVRCRYGLQVVADKDGLKMAI